MSANTPKVSIKKVAAVTNTVNAAQGVEDLESRSLPPHNPCPQCSAWQGKVMYTNSGFLEDESSTGRYLLYEFPSIHEILQRPMGRPIRRRVGHYPGTIHYNPIALRIQTSD